MTASPFAAAIVALAADLPANAVPLLRLACKAGDGGALANLNLGMALMALGQMNEAEVHLQAAAIALPDLPEPRTRLGLVAAAQGNSALAAEYFSAVLRRHPTHVPALAALASIEENRGRLDYATALLDRARAADPVEPELALAAARIALERDNSAAAAELAGTVLAAHPTHVSAAQLLARAMLHASSADTALALIDSNIARSPLLPAWALVKAFVLDELGRTEAAVAELQAATAMAPENTDILAELGRLLARLDRTEEALLALRAASRAKPDDLHLRNLLATVLWKRHRYAEMVELLQAALEQYGPHVALNMNLALVLNAQGLQNQALRAADAAVSQAGSGIDALVNRIAVLPYHPRLGHAAALRTTAGAIAAQLPASAAPLHARAQAKPRLRVGLLSGGLGVHPVGWLTLAGLEALPEQRFEIVAYSLKPRQDLLNTRFRARAALWREVASLSDLDLARKIAADDVDILIDMGGYGESGRPFVLHHRPAAVQIKWVGSQFSTTGLTSVDHMLTDHRETPAGYEKFYTENLLRLPDGYVCYLPPRYAPDVGPLPAQANGHITFGCFNNLAKITPLVLQSWAVLLRQMPTSRLVLRTHALSDTGTLLAFQARLAAAGLPVDRMQLLGGCAHSAMLESYRQIDIALDPFPYTGGLTVCEALYMGVPVVSLAGDSFAGRHALSHLGNVGLEDWVANDVAGYLDLAGKVCTDLTALAKLRATLRQRVVQSPLCDAPRFGRHLAAALNGAWVTACS